MSARFAALVRAARVSLVRAGVAVCALAAVSGLPACKACSNDGPQGADSGHAQSTVLTPEQAAQVLAKVGDETITLGDFAAALENMDQFDRLRYQSPERRKELLQEMITVHLLAREAAAKGYDKDALSQQELRAILRDAMLAEARKDVPSPNDVKEADVREYFESHRADFKDPERRRASVIVTKDEATARSVIDAAKAAPGDTQWGELVRSRSLDPQARANVPIDLAGDVGITSPPGDARGENPRIVAEVRAALFQIAELRQVYDQPVRAGDRYYVVRLTQKLAPHERKFEEAERSIRVKLAQDMLRAKEAELLAELRKTIKVEIDRDALARVKVESFDAGAAGDARAPIDAGR